MTSRPLRRRPGGLRPISTERVEVGETEMHVLNSRSTNSSSRTAPSSTGTIKGNTLASEYMTRNRQKRVKKGSNYVRSCVSLFALSFFGVATAPQYSHIYYISWCCSYMAFILCLPSVLPSDNTKIKICLIVYSGNIAAVSIFCFNRFATKIFALSKLWQDQNIRGHLCAFPKDPCRWNLCFWGCHGVGAAFMTYFFITFSIRLPPALALYKFWRSNGFYFLFIATISAIDLTLSYRAGKYDLPKFIHAGRWNIIITIEQAFIGMLCLSQQFKLFMWRLAASSAAIRIRQESSTPPVKKSVTLTTRSHRGQTVSYHEKFSSLCNETHDSKQKCFQQNNQTNAHSTHLLISPIEPVPSPPKQ
uniref:Uncharacterized protein n=1 Tax=Aureoumbra lagunensis TaxID=44058 RepID=A0A7S3NKC9_9STRA|mmetsp:Transcript_4242/g.5987  ORF Transcript_4242/g.5987 Transcript_4242/m.5987 type:complete len:361 (+) Transcript_4242:178-1260(+)